MCFKLQFQITRFDCFHHFRGFITFFCVFGQNSWQLISPVEAVGYVVVVDELLAVQNKSYGQPTILVAKSVKGEEEIPDGTVAVLTPDMPDVLSHVSVRARNSKVKIHHFIVCLHVCFTCYTWVLKMTTYYCQVCFATCFDPSILSDLQAKEGRLLCLKPTSADVIYRYFDLFMSTLQILVRRCSNHEHDKWCAWCHNYS